MPGPSTIADIFGGNIAEGVAKIISLFKVDPNLALQHQEDVIKIQAEMQGKILDSANAEIQAAAEVIKAEANSQSWLPRNVRPLLLLLWGSAITVNIMAAIFAHFTRAAFSPLVLDPWVYKLTALGFTGYVAGRTWEKVTGMDK
jgi:hypothetical protein